ncbi:hypothetical protein [Paraburkholderia sp. SIMBA_054]|uniref:hypothetical protein n=1 Tax=Paraburkholderia sp. SIMBA_054 TaxID=3085795 RepID=UPI003979500D
MNNLMILSGFFATLLLMAAIGICVKYLIARVVCPKGALGVRYWRDEWPMIYTTVVGFLVGGATVHLMVQAAELYMERHGLAGRAKVYFIVERLLPVPGTIAMVAGLVGGFIVFPPRSITGAAPAPKPGPEDQARRAQERSIRLRELQAGRAPQIRQALESKFPGFEAQLRDDGDWEMLNRGSDDAPMSFTWREALLKLDLL